MCDLVYETPSKELNMKQRASKVRETKSKKIRLKDPKLLLSSV